MIPVLISFLLVLFFFFYVVPFLLGYLLGRFGGAGMGRWGGGTVTAAYLAWMITTWLGEGYSPLLTVGRISMDTPQLEFQLYQMFTYLVLALVSFCMVYSGASRGAWAGCAWGTTGREGAS